MTAQTFTAADRFPCGVAQVAEGGEQVVGNDQLNRLREMRTRAGLDDATNDWTTLPTPTGADAEKYRSSYSYDANGNIRTADRWDQAGAPYDALTYGYKEATGAKLLRNRLYQVDDLADPTNALVNAGPGEQAVDILHTGPSGFNPQDQNIETAYNYHYDELGNLTHDAEAHIDAIAWTVAGKVRAVDHATGQGPDLEFGYGAGGQRISKQVGGTVGDPGTYREHYIRDAQGNVMATYRLHPNGAFRLQERPIYGSSRVGLYAGKVDLYPATQVVPMPQVIPVFDALLRYELTDHLGNVGTVVTGRLLPGDGAPHEAEVISAQGYEPFGSLLPGRNYSSGSYRWGFNGAEKDDELNGSTGTSYDFGARVYDPRIARFFSLDPFREKLPAISPYAFAANSPIAFIDAEGKYPIIKINSYSATCVDGKTILKVNLDVSINVAVLNQSSTVLTAAEGADIAAYIDSKGVSGAYSGALYGSDATTAAVAFHQQGGPVEIQYEVNFSMKTRYVKDASEVREGEQVLIITDSHRPDPDREIGGRADYYNGVASIDFDYATPGAVLIQSLGRQTKRSNGGVHELAHLIGFGDIYTKTRTVPGHLMGELGTGFRLGQGEIDNVVWGALIEVKNYNIQKANKAETSYYQTKDGTYMPKFQGTVSKRIEDHKRNVGAQTR